MFLGGVANADDFYVFAFDPVNHEEVFVRDQFAGSRDAPGSTNAWKVCQNERFSRISRTKLVALSGLTCAM